MADRNRREKSTKAQTCSSQQARVRTSGRACELKSTAAGANGSQSAILQVKVATRGKLGREETFGWLENMSIAELLNESSSEKNCAAKWCDLYSKDGSRKMPGQVIIPVVVGKGGQERIASTFIGTWNVGNACPPKDLSNWIPKNPDFELVAIGAQECEYQPRQPFTDCGKDWLHALSSHLGPGYKLVNATSSGQMRLSVFVREDTEKAISDLDNGVEATGVGRVMAKNGGVSIGFKFWDTGLCFVNTNRAAHPEIADQVHLGLQSMDILKQYHHVFWLGDLNCWLDFSGHSEKPSTPQAVESALGTLEQAAQPIVSSENASPSASAGGVKSAVKNHGGGRRSKRKGLPDTGVPSSISTILRKKLRTSTKDTAKAKAAAAAPATTVARATAKEAERESSVDEIEVDPSMEAAVTLAELFSKAVVRSVRPTIEKSPPPDLLQWKTTKLRSRRRLTTFIESSSNKPAAAAAAVATTDSSNPSPLAVQKQQLWECSSSPCGESKSMISLAKVEDDPICCSTQVEGEKQAEQRQVVETVVEKEEQDENTNNACSPDDSELLALPKLTSASSIESPQEGGSPAESPSFTYVDVLRAVELNSVSRAAPKFEGTAFRKVVPVRPVKKSTLCRKLKAEEKTFEELNLEQAALKHVSRKKPRHTEFVPQQQEVPHQQELASVKVEETDASCTLALGLPLLSGNEVEVKEVALLCSVATLPPAASAMAVEEKMVEFNSSVIKLETKLSGKLQRTTSKTKPALSESEKEARKQRRVQANRESARHTIRKKQVMCEGLSRKAQALTTENEGLKKEVDRMRQVKKTLIERHAELKEEVTKVAGTLEPGTSAPAPQPMDKLPDALVQQQFPSYPFGGLPLPPPYFWAFGMPRPQAAAQATGQSSEMKMGPVEFPTFFPATPNSCGTNGQAGFWNMPSSSSQGPSFFPGYLPGASMPSALPSSCGPSGTVSPIIRTMSMPVGRTDTSFAQVASERSLPSGGKAIASYKSGEFSDLKRLATKQDNAHQAYDFSGRPHFFHVGGMPMMQGRPSARASEAQRVAAAAAEARRKRIELKRSKSNANRQVG